jgi:hypothetical protein
MADKPSEYEVQQSLEDVRAWVAAPDLVSPTELHNQQQAQTRGDKSKSSEEVLLELLLAIEGDKISMDAFQFLFELVRAEIFFFVRFFFGVHQFWAVLCSSRNIRGSII